MRRIRRLGAVVLLLSACGPGPAIARPSASIEPLPITQPNATSALDGGLAPTSAQQATRQPASASAQSSVATNQTASSEEEAAIRRVIEQANDAQVQAFTQRRPELMRPTALDPYYAELTEINQDLAAGGVTAIKLLKMEWGQIIVTDNSAQATTFETWRTDYRNGSGEESRDRNDYTLVRDSGGWKIRADVHPDSALDQPGGQEASPGPSASPSPRSSRLPGTSHNWSGYTASGGSFTAVSGTWTIPQPVPGGFGADATWIGIGGLRSRDLIQAGTEQTVAPSGRVMYEAWIEKLPQFSHPVALRISPGDSVSASLTEQQEGSWQIVIKNTTTGQEFQTSEQYQSSRSSAEWVEEAPSGRRGVLPLDNFGTLTFRAASAVKDGKAVTIAQAGGRSVTMIDRHDRPIAQPSALDADGAGFSVTRVGPVGPSPQA